MAIKPKYYNLIKEGIKKYEFRRISNKKITKIIVYVSSPISRLCAILEVKTIYQRLNLLWAKTQHAAGISREEFYKYFGGKEMGYAHEIFKIQFLDPEISPVTIDGFTVPQNYRKLHENEIKIFG